MAALVPLLDNTLVVVAHPDDETIGCGCLMQRVSELRVAFATDGAPLDPQFWPKFQNRAHYASVRKLEACDALAYVDADQMEFLIDGAGKTFPDQALYRHLPEWHPRVGDAALSPGFGWSEESGILGGGRQRIGSRAELR